jgi:hypothetical protein
MEIDSDENYVGADSDTMKINHHMNAGEELYWLATKNKNVQYTCIRTPRVKKGTNFSDSLPRSADMWHGVEFTVPVQNVEIYIETLSVEALNDPSCNDTTKEVIFTSDEAQSFFPATPWPMLINPMSCIWVKFTYAGLAPNVANKMIKVVHHLESLTTTNREKLMGCPQGIANQFIMSQPPMMLEIVKNLSIK